MAALALFIFMTNWDSHLWPLLVASDDEHRTLPVGLAAMQANNLGASGLPMMMAAAVLALLPDGAAVPRRCSAGSSRASR